MMLVEAHPVDPRNSVAIVRGPLVYCLEDVVDQQSGWIYCDVQIDVTAR
ncbi:MAG: hypothetical protein R2873_02170 [Caldilineaceae bacterium]